MGTSAVFSPGQAKAEIPSRPSRKGLAPLGVTLAACLIGAITLFASAYLPLTIYFKELGQPIPYRYSDSAHYIDIAEGRIAHVSSPYSRRVLYPLLAAGWAREFRLPLAGGFLELNFIAFLVMAFCLASLLQKLGANPWWTVVALLTPLPLESLQRAYLPDLFHMSLVSLFFLLLAYEELRWALAVLFLAFLTRDNTLLICLTVIFVGWRSGQRTVLWGGLLVLLAGMAFESWFVRLGMPNRHHLPEVVYMALFVPCSFLGNALGIDFWTNSGPMDTTPWLTIPIPRALQFGSDTQIYFAYVWFRAVETYAALLTLFGCAPLVIFYMRKAIFQWKVWPLVIKIAFSYGLISYFLGTSLGRTGTFRLVGYAWPLYWVALPYLLSIWKWKFRAIEAAFLIAASLLVAWLPNLDGMSGLNHSVTWMLAIIPVLYFVTAAFLDRVVKRAADMPVQALAS